MLKYSSGINTKHFPVDEGKGKGGGSRNMEDGVAGHGVVSQRKYCDYSPVADASAKVSMNR